LGEAHMTGVGRAPSRAMGAKDVSDLQARPRHAGLSGGRRSAREVDAQPLQWALDVADRVDGDAGVERRRLQLRVSEQNLDYANIDALLEQMGGEAVPQG